MTVMPRIPSRKSKVRRSSFVAPTDRPAAVPDALSWRKKVDGSAAPKGPAAWSAASSVESDRAVVDAGPYGVIDLAVMENVPDAPGPKPQLGVVWWDRRSFREEDDDYGTIQTSFVPASLTDHVSLAPSSSPSGYRPAAVPSPAPTPTVAPGDGQRMTEYPPPWSPGPRRAAAQTPEQASVPSAVEPVAVAAPSADPPAVEEEIRPRQAGDHASLAEGQRADAGAANAPQPESRRANRDRPAPKRRGKSSRAAVPTAPAVAPTAPAAPQQLVAEPVQPLAPPVSASRHPELDESEHKRHARRSRHVELVPKTRGRRNRLAATSHPRRAMLRRRRSRRRVLVSVILVIAAFVVTLVVQNLIVTPFTVPSSSMENTLHTDDRILVNKFAYGVNDIKRGDVVVFEDPGGWIADGSPEPTSADGKNYLVKRVVGVPGDHVTCCSTAGRLTVNGREVHEPYAVIPDGQPATTPFDVTVPAGELWVLGDNRYNSRDSSKTQDLASKGFVPIADVVGQAVFKLWPLNQIAPVGSSPELASIPEQTCPT